MIKNQKTKQISKKKTIKLVPGTVFNIKITAEGANNVGINEFSFGIPILVPNAKLGDTVQVKLLKIYPTKKIAVAKLIKVLLSDSNKQINANTLPVLTAGSVLDITINKYGPNGTGIVDLANSYSNVNKLIVLKPANIENFNINDKLSVTITRVKKDYAFALVTTANHESKTTRKSNQTLSRFTTELSLKGTKFTVVLPKKAKRYLKHLVFFAKNTTKQKLVNGFEQTLFKKGILGVASLDNQKPNILPGNTILYVKPALGAKLGDKVQIRIIKFFKMNNSLKSNVAIAKIIKLNPVENNQKKTLVRASLCQMLKSGMHYGEKAIKCNARMKNYVWTRKQNLQNSTTASSKNNFGQSQLDQNNNGHIINRTNEARPFIKKGRNIINLLKTRRCLNKALAQLTKYAAKGKTFLFVGTKKAASGLVSRAALFSKKAFFVNTRWLGGMLTNWKTILKSISKIRPILKEKQVIIKDILEKRQNIKARLIQKALLLRKKSKLMLKKGRQLIQMLKQNNNNKSLFTEKTKILNNKRKEYISKGLLLLSQQRQLFAKQRELIVQSQTLKSKAMQLTNTYQRILTNLINARKKLRELKLLLILSKELHAFKQKTKQNNENLYMVSYNKFKTLNGDFIINHPPKEILNKMVAIIKGQNLIIKDNNLNLKSSNLNVDKTLILSQLLSKFNLFVPTIKTSITNLQAHIKLILKSLTKVSTLLNVVKNKMSVYVTLKTNLVTELQIIKKTLQTERSIIRVLRRKLKQISAQKRLIKFLPKLRYLPTPATRIEQTARFLMKKFVDPKMKYPMDKIYDEKLNKQSKKVAASRKKKWQRLEKYLGGIKNMTKIKEKQIRNNVAIIIGQQEEMNAVRECQKLGIKMFHIVDTNCNPTLADHYVPANDDARNSIKFILGKFITRIRLAQKLKKRFKKSKIKK
jgi:small subunit ribosomal protein S2